jgi:spermidine/putrescine ABC transporter ATP-binding subunit
VIWRAAASTATAVSLAFLVLPMLALIPMSFSSAHWLSFPPSGWSLQWYRGFVGDRDWMASVATSLKVAVLATLLACALGTPGALALARARFPGRDLVYSLILAPIIVPVMIVAIASYLFFASLRLVGSVPALAVAHAMLGVPYVVINVMAVARTLDPQLERAARGLGATAWQTFWRVTVQLVRAGMIVGALFAFITSLDEAVVALFLSGTTAVTLPRLMWDAITQDELNPTVTAIASLQVAAAVLVMGGAGFLRGRHARRAGAGAPRAEAPGDERAALGRPARPAAPGAELRLVDVSKRFGPIVAVDRVSLALRRGEFMTLLGPSGSGKTTILNMVAGFETPSEGEILLDGVPVTARPANERDLGMVFQHYALFPHMTAFENVAFPLRVRRLPAKEVRVRVDEALRLVRLEGYAGRLPRQLSGGQQQRVALARALVFQPRVLLMDEPLAALDRHLRESMQIELRRLHERLRITVLFVTHDQAEAMTLSDRIAVVHGGRIEQVGTSAELYEAPATAFIAGFIGESNVLDGVVVSADGREARVESAGGVRWTVACGGAAVGDRLRVVIRPETLLVLAGAGGAAPGPNALPAEIEDVIYLGDTLKIVARLAGQERVVIKRPNRRGVRPPDVGSRVTVAWAPEDGRVLPPSRDGG